MGIADVGKKKIGTWRAWLVIAVLLAIVAFVVYDGDNDNPDAEDEHPADEARIACEAWVRDELKSPSTAQFTDGTATGTDGDWTITGSVDSENSFGATLRSAWTCTAKVDGDDWVGNVSVG